MKANIHANLRTSFGAVAALFLVAAACEKDSPRPGKAQKAVSQSRSKAQPATLSALGPEERKRARGQKVVSRVVAQEYFKAAHSLQIEEQRGASGALEHRFKLALPRDWNDPASPRLDWTQVNVERFVVNLPSGRLESVTMEPRQRSSVLAYAPQESGTQTYLLCVNTWGLLGDTPEKESLYCVKQIRSPSGRNAVSTSRSPTSRFGEPVELRPLMPPEKALVGGDLPIMAYVGAHRARESTLFVIAPDGSRREIKTGVGGSADLRVDQKGDWRVFLVGEIEGKTAVAELSFSNAEAE